MAAAFEVLRRSLSDLWDNIFLAAFCSLTWLLAVLLIVPGPPATVALFDVAAQIARRDHFVGFSDYLRAIGRSFGVGWRWGALCLGVALVLLVDIRTLPEVLPLSVAAPVQAGFYSVLALWIVLSWLALAFLSQQVQPDVWQALRNAGLLALRHPLFTLVVAGVTALALGASLLLLIANLLFGPMLAALVGVHAVRDRIGRERAQGGSAQQQPSRR